MSVFISDIDTAKLCVQFFRPLAQCAVKLECCVVDLYEQDYEWSLSSRLQETRNKKKRSSWIIPKVVAVSYERFHNKV